MAGTVICVTASLLCKEQGITVLGVCAAYEVFVTQKVGLFAVVPTTLITQSWPLQLVSFSFIKNPILESGVCGV